MVMGSQTWRTEEGASAGSYVITDATSCATVWRTVISTLPRVGSSRKERQLERPTGGEAKEAQAMRRDWVIASIMSSARIS